MNFSTGWPQQIVRGVSRWTARLMPAAPALDDFPFTRSDVALYHRTVVDGEGGKNARLMVDEQTWSDMLLDQYSAQLATQTSIFGQQMLHHRLRGEAADADSIDRVRTLAHDAPRLARLTRAGEQLRRATSEVGALLFGAGYDAAPRWSAHLRWMPPTFLLVFGAALALGWWPLWFGVIAGWLALMTVQVRWYESAQQWDRSLHTLQYLLRTHSQLAALDDPYTQVFRDGRARAGQINRALTRTSFESLMPGAREYADWLWLKNIRHYFASRDVVRLHRDFLRDSYLLAARLEADLALARHLARTPHHCWAERAAAGTRDVVLERMVHPLLAGAAPLSFALRGQGAFISGQNGIGKSTLLRSVGLNVIVARAFGFCYADAARLPLMPVYSSMQTEDSLASGESLYIAELRRARELLALADGAGVAQSGGEERGEGAPALFIIDEIFRGTNHLESISAAAAVLHTLARSGRVIVSSHNLVLAPLLADVLAPLYVSAPDGDQSRLRIAAGVLAETNGIALLSARGFDEAIAAKARRVHDWLSDYMMHPGDCAGLLNSL